MSRVYTYRVERPLDLLYASLHLLNAHNHGHVMLLSINTRTNDISVNNESMLGLQQTQIDVCIIVGGLSKSYYSLRGLYTPVD